MRVAKYENPKYRKSQFQNVYTYILRYYKLIYAFSDRLDIVERLKVSEIKNTIFLSRGLKGQE